MSGSTETLLNRFWSHVFDKADQEAVRVPNPREGERQYIVTATPMGAGGGGAVIVEAPAFLTVEWSDSGAIVAEIMKQLMDLGVRRGDRVAILSWNCAEWVWTDIAIQSLGAVTVPIYPNSAAEQVNFILANCDARLLIGDFDDFIGHRVEADLARMRVLFPKLINLKRPTHHHAGAWHAIVPADSAQRFASGQALADRSRNFRRVG